MKNEHKKEGLFLDFLKQLHLWGYSIADKSILSITEMRTRPSSILFTLRHSLQLQECLCTIADPLMKKYILNGKPTKISVIWEVFLKVAGVHQNHWHLPNMYSMCPTQSGNQHFDNKPTKKNEASVGYAITIRSKLWRHRQSSSISSHRYLSF